MAVPIGAVIAAGKAALNAVKTNNESSTESSANVDVNPFGDAPMEIKRTEGDLGYDENPVQEEIPQEHIDEDPTANPMEVKEIADISAIDKPQDTLPQSEPLKPLSGGFSEIFSKAPGDASESFDDFFGNFLDEKENAPTQPVNYASTQDTGSSAGIPSGAPAIGSKEGETPAQPLNVPKAVNPFEEYQAIFDEFAKKEDEPLIQQAEKAYEDDKDIDAKELPFVEDDKAAEDVEDVVQAVEEGSLDEKKAEEVLQKAADDGKIDDDELENEQDEEEIQQKAPLPAPSPSVNEEPQEKGETQAPNQGKNAAAPETPKDEEKKGVLATINGKLDEANDKWEKSPVKNLLDKGVKLAQILYGFFGPPNSVSASSGETVAVNPYEDENASTTSGGMGYDEEGSVESTSTSGSAPSSGGPMSNISDTDYRTQKEQPVNTRVASQAGSGSIESKSQKGATSSGGTPVKGSVKDTFNKILAQGPAYASSREGSSFESALGGGRIGSSGGVSGGSLGQLPKEAQAKMQSEYEKIKQKVQATYKSWPKKMDLHVKEKGSVSIRTENGKEIGVKFGTRRPVSLEKVAKNAPEKLRIVEELI